MPPIPSLDDIFANDTKGYFNGDHLPKKSTAAKGDPNASGFEELSVFVDTHGREP